MNNRFHNLRLPIGKYLEENIQNYLQDNELLSISTNEIKKTFENYLPEIWKKDVIKKSNPVLMLRYLPDFIVIDKKDEFDTFLLDTKTMFTPIYLNTFPDQINKNLKDNITLENIGVIEREAYKSYISHHKSGSKVAILIACTYNPKFLFCDFVENLKILYTEKETRNYNSSGSTTPRVNIDLRKMKTLKEFVKDYLKFTNQEKLNRLISNLRNNLNFIGLPNKINLNRAKEVKNSLSKLCNIELSFKNLD